MMTKDYDELDVMVTRREEQMRGQALFEGKVTMSIEGSTVEVDYNLTNKETLSGTDVWSNKSSTPYTDIDEWVEKILETSGINPNTMVMAPDVSRVLVNNEKFMKLFDYSGVESGRINPQAIANGLTYFGTHKLTGLDLYRHVGKYRDLDGNLKAYVPNGKILIGSTEARTTQFYGPVTFVKDPITYNTPRIPREFVDENANIRYLEVNSRPLPVIHDIDAFFVATVL